MQAKAYATAIAALVAAVLLRWALDPLIGDTLPLVTLFGAVAIAVWVGGYRPAIVVAPLGYLVCNFLFIAPRGVIGPMDPSTVVGLTAYVFTCSLIIVIGEAMRVAKARAASTYVGSFSNASAWSGVFEDERAAVHSSREGASNAFKLG